MDKVVNIESVQESDDGWQAVITVRDGKVATLHLGDDDKLMTAADVRAWVGQLSLPDVASMRPDEDMRKWDCFSRKTFQRAWSRMTYAVEQQAQAQDQAAHWITKMVFDLAGQGYNQLTHKGVASYVRHTFDIRSEWATMRDRLHAAFTEAMTEALDEAKWSYEDNREAFLRSKGGRVVNDEVVATNLEDEETVVLRFLATVTPYQLYRVREDVREAAQYALDDYINEGSLVGDDGGEDCAYCAEAAQEAFGDAVALTAARVTQEIAVEAAEAVLEAAREAS